MATTSILLGSSLRQGEGSILVRLELCGAETIYGEKTSESKYTFRTFLNAAVNRQDA